MRGIYINGQHTGQDMGLVMTERNIGAPVVQTYKVDVPGKNGSLDLSESLTGDIRYSNRPLDFKFITDGNREKVLTAIDKMMMLHGQQAEIITEDYPDYYYKGRISISHKDYGRYAEFEISVDAEPFRTARKMSSYSFDVSSSKECLILNNGMPVIPSVAATDTVTIIRNGQRVSISAGSSYIDAFFKLQHDVNRFTIEGNAAVTFEFTEVFI